MYSRGHAVVSLGIGIAVVTLSAPPINPLLVVGFAVILGVGLDLDHFPIARFNVGDWRHLRRWVREPTLAVRDQAAIFDEGTIYRDQRLLSHALLGGVAVIVLAPVSVYLSGVAAVVCYGHLLSDLANDVRTREAYFASVADEVVETH